MNTMTVETLKELMTYDLDTGYFYWKQSNNQVSTTLAAGSISSKGYRNIKIKGKQYKAHRLAWLYVYGTFPKEQVDHIDGNRDNNAINNLRECSNSENGQNRSAYKINKNGYTGVDYHKAYRGQKKYRARITLNRKVITIGHFDTAEEASDAYLNAKKEYHTYNPIPNR